MKEKNYFNFYKILETKPSLLFLKKKYTSMLVTEVNLKVHCRSPSVTCSTLRYH